MARWKLLAALGGLAGLIAWLVFGDSEAPGVVGDARQLFMDAINGITQGARLTHCPYDKTTGIVPCDPQTLADQAGATLEEYALARNIASEEGNSSVGTQALVAYATKNKAAAAGLSIFELLTRTSSKHAAQHTVDHGGRFGTQADLEVWVTTKDGRTVHPSDREASTAQDPYDGHLAVARGVLSGAIPDVSGGAVGYDRPSGEAKPEQVAADRAAAGLVPADVPDVGQGDLRLWTQGLT